MMQQCLRKTIRANAKWIENISFVCQLLVKKEVKLDNIFTFALAPAGMKRNLLKPVVIDPGSGSGSTKKMGRSMHTL